MRLHAASGADTGRRRSPLGRGPQSLLNTTVSKWGILLTMSKAVVNSFKTTTYSDNTERLKESIKNL